MYANDTWAKAPDFVMFCGDGDFNYRNIDRSFNENFLPPYEDISSARCTDDWFVDFNHQDGSSLLPEMTPGRLTAANTYELSSMVNKIISFDEEPEFGSWRNRITLVADDEMGSSSSTEDEHIRVQEELSKYYIPAWFDKVKIYLTEYEPTLGREKPQAANDFIETINRGTFLINYLGHGNPSLWAHEHVFVLSRDFPRIQSSRRLPLYVAFTCDWAYWDNPSSQSFPEQLLAAPNRGAIGAIASTRLTYAFSNSNLARNFFRSLFDSTRSTMGEALMLSKHRAVIQLGPTYHFLGDPTLQVAIPQLKGDFTTLTPYPLVPLAHSTVAARVYDTNDNFDPEFSGELEFLIQDTEIQRIHMVKWEDANGVHESPLPYKLPGSLVYRGLYDISNGEFNGNFIVPLDVTMGGNIGRVVGYFHNDEIDGVMFIDSVAFAEHAAIDVGVDTIPPTITIYFDHRGYRDGDKIGPEPLLIVDVSDSSGLNLTGEMGHGISICIDDGKPIDLTADFSYHINSYQYGSLQRRIGPLTVEKHDIEIIAWDSFNNFAVKDIEVEITGAAGGLMVERILNWPNPFRKTTHLTFIVNKAVNYEIYVYTVGGRRIWSYNGSTARPGLISDVMWNGHDSAGRTVGNGVYLYKVIAWDEDGGKAEGLGRIAYVR